MKKTIFEYDSSDDERTEIIPNSTDLYAIGSAIFSHQIVHDAYKTLKTNAGYQHNRQYSKSITQYLIKKIYTEDVLNAGQDSLTDTLGQKLSNDIVSLQEKVTKINKLYQQLKDIQIFHKTPKGKINTENFLCFKKLKTFLDKPDDTVIQSALCETFGIQDSKKQSFLSKIQEIEHIQDTMDNLSNIINTYPIIRIEAFTEPDNNLATEPAVIKNDSSILQNVEIILQAKKLYQQLKDIQIFHKTPKGKINTENFLCFKKLKVFLDKPDDTVIQNALCEMFGIQDSKKQSFLSKVKEIEHIQDTMDNLSIIINKSLLIYKEKLLQVLVDGTPLDVTFLLDTNNNNILAYDEYDHRNKVEQTINHVKFFEKSNSASDASKFLAASLFYQKLLKTLAKTLNTTVFPKSMNGEYSLLITDTSQQKIKITHEFTTGLSRKDKVVSLGDYQDISKQLVTVGEKLDKSNKELIDLFKKIIKGTILPQDFGIDTAAAVDVLYNIVYLLFSCEPNRNPEALVSNAMFLELVEKGKYKLSDMATKMPMAMKEAVDVGRYYHEVYEKQKLVNKAYKNDYKVSGNKQDRIKEFQTREKQLIKDFLSTEQHAYDEYLLFRSSQEDQLTLEQFYIRKLIQDWYGIEVKLKAGGEKIEEFFSNDHDYVSPIKASTESNKYCSVILRKLVDYKENTSGVLDFKFVELGQSECIEIDRAIKLKLKEIIFKKDPSSKKRLFYEAFPEELCYSGFSVKKLKLGEDKAIEYYCIKYCLGNTESEIINRLFYESVLDIEEWEDYIALNQLQHESFTERKTQCSDTGYKYKFEITKQEGNNIQSLQNKFTELVFNDNNLPFNQQLQNTEVLGNHNGYISDVEDLYN